MSCVVFLCLKVVIPRSETPPRFRSEVSAIAVLGSFGVFSIAKGIANRFECLTMCSGSSVRNLQTLSSTNPKTPQYARSKVTRSMQRWVSTKLSISRLTFCFCVCQKRCATLVACGGFTACEERCDCDVPGAAAHCAFRSMQLYDTVTVIPPHFERTAVLS